MLSIPVRGSWLCSVKALALSRNERLLQTITVEYVKVRDINCDWEAQTRDCHPDLAVKELLDRSLKVLLLVFLSAEIPSKDQSMK